MPELHTCQQEVLDSAARFKVIAAGRRWGKTRLCAAIALANAVYGRRSWWAAPTYAIGSIGWRQIKALARQIPNFEIRESDRMVVFGSGFVQVKSADNPDALRGEGLDLIVVDEAAHIRNLRDTWEQSLRPALSDRQGEAIFISTPKGFNYFYELFNRSKSDNEWQSFQFPTSDNPHIEPSEIETARQSLPALVFRQEYDAEFVQLQGAMFERDKFQVVDNLPQIKSVVRGWDLAATKAASGDLTVGAKVGFTSDGGICVIDVVRGRWEWPEALRIIGNTARADGGAVTQIIEDNGQQKAMLQLIRREQALLSLPFRGVTEVLGKPMGDKVARANVWLPRVEQGKAFLMRGNWNSAFLDVVCSFPEGTHDDDVDAVSAAVIGLGSGGFWVMGQAR